MSISSRIIHAGIRLIFVIYLFMLVKIILFKMQNVEPGFLWNQLYSSLSHPGLVYQRLLTGNLVPFREITRTMELMTGHSLFNLIGNVAIFVPFGLFTGIMLQKNETPARATLIYSFLMSLFLECAQLLLRIGQFDVDDLLLNTFGGLIGYFSFSVIARAINGLPNFTDITSS
ncbi:VanZ family protein [Paenibacillus antibioticophila]|uniref:VanZ family protein n=1 Tax=Paenibacillus antibioticophila TaxID=1274374 RepID=UPI0005C840DB|nr:VanZ family protein [Paenibacillus antibioticophila]